MKTPEVWITVGQRGFNDENLKRLCNYEIAAYRINTGRSSLNWAYQTIRKLVSMGIAPKNIYLDIGNKKPRITLQNKDSIEIKIEDIISISHEVTKKADGWLSNCIFFEELSLDDTVYFGDGEIECSVVEITQQTVKLKSLSNGTLTNNVAIGIVGKELVHFHIDSKEIDEINKILLDFPICLILSFVEKSDDIICSKELFPKAHNIVPKIETWSAVENFDSIVDVAKTIFIGRGDLGLSAGLEKIGIIQKQLVLKAHEAGCYVALGTGTLDSLKWSQVPLRAEIIDITNSCYESIEAIVLTSETAGAKQPFKAIDFLMKTLSFIRQST